MFTLYNFFHLISSLYSLFYLPSSIYHHREHHCLQSKHSRTKNSSRASRDISKLRMSTKATKGTKASKAKANKAIKAGKGNASRKKSNNPVLVNNKPIDEVPASPELDILMSVELVQTAVAAIVRSTRSPCPYSVL